MVPVVSDYLNSVSCNGVSNDVLFYGVVECLLLGPDDGSDDDVVSECLLLCPDDGSDDLLGGILEVLGYETTFELFYQLYGVSDGVFL